MKYHYEATDTQTKEVIQGIKMDDGKTIKEPVKIKFEIEFEKIKLISIMKKFRKNIPDKIIELLEL